MADARPIPRAAYGLAMLLTTLVAVGVAWGVARGLGSNGVTERTLLLAFLAGSFATAGPVVLRVGKDHWGVLVLVCGMLRGLVIFGVCMMARETDPEILRRPLFLGGLCGAVLLMVVESILAIRILSGLEKGAGPGAVKVVSGGEGA